MRAKRPQILKLENWSKNILITIWTSLSWFPRSSKNALSNFKGGLVLTILWGLPLLFLPPITIKRVAGSGICVFVCVFVLIICCCLVGWISELFIFKFGSKVSAESCWGGEKVVGKVCVFLLKVGEALTVTEEKIRIFCIFLVFLKF